ncbi:unnamed protein product [Ostreobium quekettii]|uniref:Uncharacterized protein n=1 Tax=Ostreobium quekettii TaxID=121088 RepID=A0A8S1IYZ6_9CHLO|nr:unnamed protein product [Ostreobium quekettii]|eukprot:evm.model.scf_374.8 EVM.evm.TU.scf_374.8   scf_374:74248-77580(-)
MWWSWGMWRRAAPCGREGTSSFGAVWNRLAGCIHAGCGRADAAIRALSAQSCTMSIGGHSSADTICSQVPLMACIGSGNCIEVVRLAATEVGPSNSNPSLDVIGKETRTSAPMRAALWTGRYATLLGLMLMLFPSQLFGLAFNTAVVTRGWIRMGGCFLALVGMQYIGTAVGDGRGLGASGFYSATIFSRLFLVATCCAVVVLGEVEVALLALAAANGLGALAMRRAMRSSG